MHATICDTIADLVQNAVEAGANQIELLVSTGRELIEVEVKDNGKGMDAATLAKVQEPFFSEAGKHDHRRVGLGIPLIVQTVEAANGTFDISSTPGKGTSVHYTLDANHLDTPPLGDLPGTLTSMMALGGEYDLIVTRQARSDSYQVSRADLIEALDNLSEAGNLILAREYLRSQEESLIEAN